MNPLNSKNNTHIGWRQKWFKKAAQTHFSDLSYPILTLYLLYTWKNIKKAYKNDHFKISEQMFDKKF